MWSGTGRKCLRPFSCWALSVSSKKPHPGSGFLWTDNCGVCPHWEATRILLSWKQSLFCDTDPHPLPFSCPGSEMTGSERECLTQAGPTRYSPACLQPGWRGSNLSACGSKCNEGALGPVVVHLPAVQTEAEENKGQVKRDRETVLPASGS